MTGATGQRAPGAALVDAELRINPQVKLGGAYSGQLASHVRDSAVKGDLFWTF